VTDGAHMFLHNGDTL